MMWWVRVDDKWFRPRHSSKGYRRCHEREAGTQAHLRVGEALKQRSRDERLLRGCFVKSSDACVVCLDLRGYPGLIITRGEGSGETSLLLHSQLVVVPYIR